MAMDIQPCRLNSQCMSSSIKIIVILSYGTTQRQCIILLRVVSAYRANRYILSVHEHTHFSQFLLLKILDKES